MTARYEYLDRRVLGAIRFLDGTTGVRVTDSLMVTGENLRLVRNQSGYTVIVSAEGLEHHTVPFDAPLGTPAPGSLSFEIEIRDPTRRYLPRRATIRLPRVPNPAHADSILKPIDVRLYPAPVAPTGSRWSVIRATVLAAGSGQRLGGALIHVIRTVDSVVLARGISDERGEALVAVEGIPITTWDAGDGPVMTNEIDAQLEAIVDPAAVGLPDPDDLEARRASLRTVQQNVKLASGRTLVTTLSVNLS